MSEAARVLDDPEADADPAAKRKRALVVQVMRAEAQIETAEATIAAAEARLAAAGAAITMLRAAAYEAGLLVPRLTSAPKSQASNLIHKAQETELAIDPQPLPAQVSNPTIHSPRYLATKEAAAYCGYRTGAGLRKAAYAGLVQSTGKRGGRGTSTWDVVELDRFMASGRIENGEGCGMAEPMGDDACENKPSGRLQEADGRPLRPFARRRSSKRSDENYREESSGGARPQTSLRLASTTAPANSRGGDAREEVQASIRKLRDLCAGKKDSNR